MLDFFLLSIKTVNMFPKKKFYIRNLSTYLQLRIQYILHAVFYLNKLLDSSTLQDYINLTRDTIMSLNGEVKCFSHQTHKICKEMEFKRRT